MVSDCSRSRGDNLVDLGVGKSMRREALALGSHPGFELLPLVLLIAEVAAGDDPFGERFETGNLAVDHVEFFDRFEEFALRRDKLFVSQPGVEQRGWPEATDSPSMTWTFVMTAAERGGDAVLRFAGAVDDHAGEEMLRSKSRRATVKGS